MTGAPGSGKTTGTLVHFERGLLANKTGLLILESKPEESKHHDSLILESGRQVDHIIFGPGFSARMNVFDALREMKADAKQYSRFLLVLGEVIGTASGGSSNEEPIWRNLKELYLETAIELLIQAYGRFEIADLERFIASAPSSNEEIKTDEFRGSYFNHTIKLVHHKEKTAVERRNFEHAKSAWLVKYPVMASKLRSSFISDIDGIIHPLTTGIAWELLSTETTFTPADLARGKIIDCRCPVSTYGASGAVINGALKFLTQLYCVRRHARPDDTIICIIADEYWQHITSRDPGFLNECRSHNACMLMLLQSIWSIHNALGAKGEARGEELLGSVGLKVCHTLSDSKSAEYFSGLLGMRDVVKVGGTERPQTHGQSIYGDSGFTANFNTTREPVLEPRAFLSGLRSGQGGIVDGILIRNGAARFSNGENFLHVEFAQS